MQCMSLYVCIRVYVYVSICMYTCVCISLNVSMHLAATVVCKSLGTAEQNPYSVDFWSEKKWIQPLQQRNIIYKWVFIQMFLHQCLSNISSTLLVYCMFYNVVKPKAHVINYCYISNICRQRYINCITILTYWHIDNPVQFTPLLLSWSTCFYFLSQTSMKKHSIDLNASHAKKCTCFG